MNVFIIAEAGVNHNGSIDLAKKLIDVASASGADAVKFQTFKADNLATKKAQKAIYQKENTDKEESQFNMLKKLELIKQDSKPEDIQTVVYSTGKENGYEKKLREWFILIYEVLFGSKDGPRMGFFISFFGIDETIKLINQKIKNK